MSCRDKTIVLGVSGGIACYKAAELVRLLVKEGARVHVVMTVHAKEFVSSLTFQTLSRRPVLSDLFSLTEQSEITHVSLAQDSDAVVIAPATANIIGKIARGIADDLLTTMVLAAQVPILLAPAMNTAMWDNPLFQDNLKRLRSLGYKTVGPVEGDLAGGYEGKGMGRLAEPADILRAIDDIFRPLDFSGEKILITAGATQEPLDPVRFISNRSSGKMGMALAKASRDRGAHVTLITGPVTVDPPPGVVVIRVRTTEEMRRAVLEAYPSSSIAIMAAAVCDFSAKKPLPSKIKRKGKPFTLELVETPDILSEIGARKDSRLLVGFAAETDSLLKNAKHKLSGKNLDLIAANDVSSSRWGFDSDHNKVTLIFRTGKVQSLPSMKKIDVAHRMLDAIRGIRPVPNLKTRV